jgi:hypothetical protein
LGGKSIAGNAREVEVKTQGSPLQTLTRVQRRPDAVRGIGLPQHTVFKVIEQVWQLRQNRQHPHHHCQALCQTQHYHQSLLPTALLADWM